MRSHKHDFDIGLNGCFLQQAIANLPMTALAVQLKPHIAKQSLQRCLNNQILDHKIILDLCKNEMITFLEFVRRTWSVLKILRLRNDMKVGTLHLSYGVVTV